ncbi:MAG: hypothetical protein P4M07_25945 [Xanthobacteraceae bacterium]|nr:hypothetical protein [Xanthobacteraceae bacterium]
MLSVTGGAFWKPYDSKADRSPAAAKPELYQDRPPLDLENARLRKLAAALGPAYVRISGTWANTTYVAEAEERPLAPPPGFSGVLTRVHWRSVVDFARAVDAEIVTSFAISEGTRDSAGVWTTGQASRLIDATRTMGGRIAAAEFMNEPTLAVMNGAPAGYAAAHYGRDFAIFHAFARQAAPDMLILGPGVLGGSVGPQGAVDVDAPLLRARDLLLATRPATLDAVSYHFYGALSQRCSGSQTRAEEALSEQWLGRTDGALAFTRLLRDELASGKPIWLTETADAACGGNPWAPTFLDSFRYLDQLGRLARQGVKVVIHNTLVWSDYGLLDEGSFRPRPNYWAAVLWRRFMGSTVLEAGVATGEGLRLYAHCLRGTSGGVALLAINTSRTRSGGVRFPTGLKVRRATMSAPALEASQVLLNGHALALDARDDLPDLDGEPLDGDAIELAPATITFITIPKAGNRSCR